MDRSIQCNKFNAKDIQLMKNFNLRYECLDARDDFHATLEKTKQSSQQVESQATNRF